MNDRPTHAVGLAGVVEATLVFLFFYQALRVLFSVLFGMIYDALFAGTTSLAAVGLWLIVVMGALLTPLAVPRRPQAWRVTLVVSAVLVFVARIPLTFNDPQTRLVASIVIVAGTGLYLAARLRDGPRDVVRALIMALVADQLLRAAGHTWDVTLRPQWWPGQVVVSLALCLLAGWLFRQRPAKAAAGGIALGLPAGLAWGGWLFLEMSLLAFPNAVARWSNAPYPVIAPLLFAVPLIPLTEDLLWMARRGRAVGAIAAIVLLGGLAVGGLPTNPVLALVALLLAQLAALVLLVICFSPGHSNRQSRMPLSLALGGIVFLILSFAYAFAFTYAYTLDLFRGIGLPVCLAAGLLVALPALRRLNLEAWARPPRARLIQLGLLGLVALVAILAWPRTPHRPVQGVALRLATYNIHYGYDTDWHLSLEAQAQTIEAAGADMIMLQEVDTGRPTSYMIDDALWLARRLGMEVVYLPCVEHLTGIALLSRYPVLEAETLLLPSELEQTGIIWAKVDVSGIPVNGFATWLGLEPAERARQLDAALPFIASHPGPAAFGGDLNSTPDSPVYAGIAAARFADPFAVLGLGSPPTDPAVNPTKRIDFVWLRELTPLDARVLESTASDHRMVVVEATLPAH
jgi:endonuclease/exonuclease/phosphatase family metal-dependent hydrolase